MKIIVQGLGLHASETRALSRLEAELRDSWHGYSSVVIRDSQGSMEFDLLVVTHDRVLIVELKNWRGRLTASDGKWYIDGKYRSVSPLATKHGQSLRLKNIFNSELKHFINYTPFVEAHVVLCGEATPAHLSEHERRNVHTLEDFLKINDHYDNIITGHQKLVFNDLSYKRPNHPDNIKHFDNFFRGPRVALATFKIKGYEANKTPDHEHDKKLFAEYPAVHDQSHNLKSMIRRWDLAVLGIINREDSTWKKIVSREDHLYRTASATNSELQHHMLRPIESPDDDNISVDCVAMYEIKNNTRRLGDYISLNGHKWSPEQKLDIVRALIAPFSEMHSMGVAHRDIQPQILWYCEDNTQILASGFHASFMPEKGTVKGIQDILKSNASTVPEDVFGPRDGEIPNHFAQDVYLIGVVAHKICFPSQKITEDDGVAVWQPVENDPFEGKLDHFFEKSLELEQKNRYSSASEMFAEFNAISLGKDAPFDDTKEVIEQLGRGDFIKRDLSPFSLMGHFQPIQGESPNLFGDKIAYRCLIDGTTNGLLKFWPKAAIDHKNPGANRRLLRMRRRIEKAIEAKLPITEVVQYGMFGEGSGLFILTRYESGLTWKEHAEKLVLNEDKLRSALILCDLLIHLHSSDFSHGDLHPENILVLDGKEDTSTPKMVLIDALDYGDDASTPYNTQYGPLNSATTDGYGRDKFAVYQMIDELFSDAVPEALRAEFQAASEQPNGIPVDLSLLRESLTTEIDRLTAPPVVSKPPLRLIHGGHKFPDKATLLQGEGLEYHLSVKISSKNKLEIQCLITAHYKQLMVILNPELRKITSAWVVDSGLSDYAQELHRANVSFSTPVTIERGVMADNKPNNFLEFLMGQDAVLDLLEDMFSAKQAEENIEVERPVSAGQTIRPHELWKTVMESEGEQRLKVELKSLDILESKSGAWLIPCVLKLGNELEFIGDEDEEIGVYLADEARPFGWVIAKESGDETLAVRPQGEYLGSFKKKVGEGSELFFESKRNSASRFRRQKAMDRVLSGHSKIQNLPAYFDEQGETHSGVIQPVPDQAFIRSIYDGRNGSSETLNSKQADAFQRVISEGPVSVLQGPPGTGKTAFVSKLIHYLFDQEIAGNILLVGQSHTSVDAVAIKAKEMCEEMGTVLSMVRLGQEHLIDEKLLQCHSSSIQSKMRHKFQREYERRINSLASRLMLDHAFVEEVAKLHRSISPLLARASVLLGNINSLSERKEQVIDRDESIAAFKSSLDDCAEFINRNIETRGYEFDLPEVTHPGYWRELTRHMAIRHGVTNQIAIQRLNHLIAISKDWIDVLASGSASFDKFFVKSSQLVTGTLVGMGAKWLNIEEQQFDWVIVDEAARASASELMIAIQCGKRVLLVGDHRQLPPHYDKSHVRHVARELGIDEGEVRKTDFERAFIVNNGLTLDTQYRMIEPIGAIISSCFYSGQLKSHRTHAPQWCAELPYPLNKPVTWIDSGIGERATNEEDIGDGKLINRHEAAVCLHILRQLTAESSLEKLREQKTEKQPFPIAIIVMYRAQKQLLEAELSSKEWAAPIRNLIKISTTDAYQGREATLVILSLVRNNPERREGYLIDQSRINVALSRAQERLVVIGSRHMWEVSNERSSLGEVLKFIGEQTKSGNGSYHFVDGTTIMEGARND